MTLTQQVLVDEVERSQAVALLDALESCFHGRASEWVFLREFRVGTGRGNNFAQRLDGFALNCLPHQAMKRVCYEVKVSRSDFACELRQPLKRRIGLRYSNEFYFVVPLGLLQPAEIPVECGLIEVAPDPSGEWRCAAERTGLLLHFDPRSCLFCSVTIPAPWRDTPGPTWQLTAAMLRHVRRQTAERPPVPPRQQKFTW